ncbi:MAG: hypothetical protein PUB45_03730 [Bacteroidales bacterium]|nr:hypothetical protein [Bacteroidales bacterium]
MLIFFCFSLSVSAQRIEEVSHTEGRWINVQVYDQDTKAKIPGVAVSFSQKKKYLELETGESGNCSCQNPFTKDSILVSTHILGYHDFSAKIKFKSLAPIIDIYLKQKADTLTTLIFRDKAILMVSRGDTLVYNVNLLEHQEGDNLGSILNRLPGISVDNGVVMAGGQPVSKMLVNGTMLFGNNLEAAMSLLYADEVTQVRVFDEHDRERLIEADTLGRKQRVIDVTTKTKIDKILSLNMEGTVGAYTEEDLSDGLIAEGFANVRRFDANNQEGFVARAMYGKNILRMGLLNNPQFSKQPSQYANAMVSIQRTKEFDSILSLTAIFDYDNQISNSFVSEQYLPGSELEMCTYENSIYGNTSNNNLKVTGRYYTRLSDNSSFYVLVKQLGFKTNSSSQESGSILWKDGIAARSQLLQRGLQGWSVTENVVSGLTINAAKDSRKPFIAEIEASYKGSQSQGIDSRIDTLNILSPIRLLADKRQINHNPEIRLSGSHKLSEKITMKSDIVTALLNSHTVSEANDLILNVVDDVNTMDYFERRIHGRAGMLIRYEDIRSGINADASVAINDEYLTLTDIIPQRQIVEKKKLSLDSQINLDLKLTDCSIKVNYLNENRIPSALLLRNWLDNSSSMFLNAGNPDLKPQRNHKFEAEGSFPLFGSTYLIVSADGVLSSDFICNSVQVFEEDVLLADYQYNAKAGSTLSRPTNAGNASKANINLITSSSFLSQGGNLFQSIGYSISDTPFVLSGKSRRNRIDNLRFLTKPSIYRGNFDLDLTYKYTFGRQLSDDNLIYYSNSHDCLLHCSFVMGKHWKTTMDLSYSNMKTDRGFSNEMTKADFSLMYMFGPKNAYKAELLLSDAFNDAKSKSVSLTNQYIRTCLEPVFGRLVVMRFSIDIRS